MDEKQLELLEKDGYIIIAPKGRSMLPMITEGQDAVKVEKLTGLPGKYDVVLYLRGDGVGIIHRILRYRNGKWLICGDNTVTIEYVDTEQIRGIVTEFYHNNRWHSVKEPLYVIYSRLWSFLNPVRFFIFHIISKMKSY